MHKMHTATVDVFDVMRTRGGRRLAMEVICVGDPRQLILYTRSRQLDDAGRYEIDFEVTDVAAREVRVLAARPVQEAA
jgi:hypothetical protein